MNKKMSAFDLYQFQKTLDLVQWKLVFGRLGKSQNGRLGRYERFPNVPLQRPDGLADFEDNTVFAAVNSETFYFKDLFFASYWEKYTSNFRISKVWNYQSETLMTARNISKDWQG